jgi:hypothetical protein
MAEDKKWIVTTSGEESLDDVRRRLTDEGFDVEEVFDAIGCIRGGASDDVAERLRSVPGVADVSPEPPPIDIGPPDSSIS